MLSKSTLGCDPIWYIMSHDSSSRISYRLGILKYKLTSQTYSNSKEFCKQSRSQQSPASLKGGAGSSSNSDACDPEYQDIMLTSSSRNQSLMVTLLNMTGSLYYPYQSLDIDYESQSTILQSETETKVLEAFIETPKCHFDAMVHGQFIHDELHSSFPAAYKFYDSNHPWLIYWHTNAANLLKAGNKLNHVSISRGIDKIETCINDNGLGGIGGGANQLGHVAATYAAILVLVSANEKSILCRIRQNIYIWLLSLKHEDGSFAMHINGERDTRSTYCALVISSLLGIMTLELTANTIKWLDKCQTYEGGFSSVPGTEAHGGYTFCGFASYLLLLLSRKEFKEKSNINIPALIRWSALRQCRTEGGLSGRTNKLVDACYSFWIGAVYSMLESLEDQDTLFDREATRNYILRCSQSSKGGFRDKPGKSVDAYHTNYTICGLSLCEYQYRLDSTKKSTLAFKMEAVSFSPREKHDTEPLSPVFCIPISLISNHE